VRCERSEDSSGSSSMTAERPDRIDLQLAPALAGLAQAHPESLAAFAELRDCQAILTNRLGESWEAWSGGASLRERIRAVGPSLLGLHILSDRMTRASAQALEAARRQAVEEATIRTEIAREATHAETFQIALSGVADSQAGRLLVGELRAVLAHWEMRVARAVLTLIENDAPIAGVIPDLTSLQAEVRKLAELVEAVPVGTGEAGK
jgi:hypothetical protein